MRYRRYAAGRHTPLGVWGRLITTVLRLPMDGRVDSVGQKWPDGSVDVCLKRCRSRVATCGACADFLGPTISRNRDRIRGH